MKRKCVGRGRKDRGIGRGSEVEGGEGSRLKGGIREWGSGKGGKQQR